MKIEMIATGTVTLAPHFDDYVKVTVNLEPEEVDKFIARLRGADEEDVDDGKYIVELEDGVWLDVVKSGDPGRTLVKDNAEVFGSRKKARVALELARKMRPFHGARVIDIGEGAEKPRDRCPQCLGTGLAHGRDQAVKCSDCGGFGYL